MAMLEDVFRMAMGVVVLVLLVLVLYKALLPPECDPMANATALALANAIDIVANGDQGIKPWNEDSIPPDTAVNSYYPVPIRLCEESSLKTLSAGFTTAGPPSYQVLYEHFPDEAPFSAWTESYPWSGGAGSALTSYAMLRCGSSKRCLTAVFTGGTSEIARAVVKIGQFTYKAPIKMITGLNIFRKTWDKMKAKLDAMGGIVAEAKPAGFVAKYIDKKIITLTDVTTGTEVNRMALTEAKMLELGWIDEVEQLLPGGKTAKRLVVNADKRVVIGGKTVKVMDVISVARDQMPAVERQMFDDTFYIPSRFGFIENRKNIWRENVFNSKKSISGFYKSTRFYKYFHDPLKESVNKYEDVYSKYFKPHYGERDMLEQAENNLVFVMKSPEAGKAILKTGFDNPNMKDSLIADLNKLREPGEKAVQNLNDVTDIQMLRFFKSYRDSYMIKGGGLMQAPAGVAPLRRSLDNFKKEMNNDMMKMSPTEFTNTYFKKWDQTTWDSLSGADKLIIQNKLAGGDPILAQKIGFGEVKAAYDSGIYAMKRSGLETTMQAYPTGSLSFARTAPFKRYNEIFNERINSIVSKSSDLDSKAVVLQMYLTERMTGKDIEKFSNPAIAYARSHAGKWVFIDLRGRTPWSSLLEIAPGGGVSTMRNTEAMTTDVREGGCEWNSICLVTRNSPHAISLNTSTAAYSVKLWRPKPSTWERIPIFIQTIWFYASVEEDPRMYIVSPCFGQAKVWKSGSTVYVTVEKCNTPGDPGCSASSNYCYADSKLVWGTNDDPQLPVTIATWLGSYFGCTAAGLGTTAMSCGKVAGYFTIAEIWGWTVIGSNPTNPQNSTWGYWNYYKASDSCDWIDTLSSFRIKPVKIDNKVVKGTGWNNKINDVCMGLQIYGDSWLAWPVKGEYKGCSLTATDIKENAAKCAWNVCNNDNKCNSEDGETKENCPNDCR